MARIQVLVVTLFFLLGSCYSASGQTNRVLEDFPFSTPEKQGINSGTLDSMLRFIRETNQNIHHLTIIRNEHTIVDADIYPYSSHYLHDIASVTKSITALLIGIGIDKQFIRNEDEPVLKFFPEIKSSDSVLNSLKIKHLVTMTSGFACGSTDGEKALSDMRNSKDWVRFIFDLPIVAAPGKSFSYCSCNFYLLAEIIYRATHLTPHDFARKYLFALLKIQKSEWLSNYKNINHGWGDLFLFPEDMAKLGILVLQKGKWQDKQIISQHWVNKCLTTVSMLNEEKGYGYGWWTYDNGGFYEAAGRGRQTISIIPARNMVVTMLGGEFDAGAIGKYIFQSIQSDKALPENITALAKLKANIKQVGLKPVVQEKMLINDTVYNTLNHRTIVFEKNITEIDSLQLKFHSTTGGMVIFYKGKRQERYPFALSRRKYEIAIDSTLHLPAALQGGFTDSGKFILHYNQLCRVNNFYFSFFVTGDRITTTVEETTNFIKINLASSLR
ncbi:MAG TPA: serine hydrolase domain-containing protein [Flavitalea sp.]|nr:serine hydrolase domain-containing protein [Flavitalea sp.]